MEDQRKVEAMVDGVWERCQLRQILPGTLFRMYEPDGTPVRDGRGRTEFKALGRAYKDKDKVWTIEAD